MRTPAQVIQVLESDNSRLAKEAVIATEAQAGNTDFFKGCRLALDCMITFGLKAVPEKTDKSGPGLKPEVFTKALEGLISRKVTGNQARDLVKDLMTTATQEQWNFWYRRILIKDLRCGVTEKTINNVVAKKFPQYTIPVFECQLAHDSANHESKVSGKKIVEIKLDGVRVLTIVHPQGKVDQYSRNGKELHNFKTIAAEIASVGYIFDEPMVLGAEAAIFGEDHAKAGGRLLTLWGVSEEIADVAIYLLELCDVTGIDLAQAIEAKLAKNAIKYPTEKSRGRVTPP